MDTVSHMIIVELLYALLQTIFDMICNKYFSTVLLQGQVIQF